MFRRLSVFYALFAITSAACAFSVSGTVSGGDNQSLKYVWAVPTGLDTPYVTIVIPFFNTYSFLGGLPEGSYVMFSFQDVSGNFLPDPDESRGFYGGQPPELLVLTSDTSDIDIELSPPNSGGFTGAVSYDGVSSGVTFIVVHRTPAFTDSIHGFGAVTNGTGVGNYIAFVDSFGIYYAYAFMDLNTNLQHDPDEPYGIHGGSTPEAINVQPTDFPQNVDITLEVPNDTSLPPAVLPMTTALCKIYPNPFNSETVIPFTVAVPEHLELSVFDLLGRRIGVLAKGVYGAGEHQVILRAGDMPSRLYFVILRTESHSSTRRLLLLK